MRKTLRIIRREYREIVRRKSFIVGLFLIPAIIAGTFLIPILLMGVQVDKQKTLAIIDGTGDLYPAIADRLDSKLKDGSREYLLVNQPVGENLDSTRRHLAVEIDKERLDAYLYVPSDVYDSSRAEYCGKSVSDFEELRRLQLVLTQSVVEHRLTGRGLDPKAIKEWTRRVKLKEVKIVKGVEKRGGFGRELLTSFAFAMTLYMVIVIFGVMVMRGVMEEKSSRMVELLLSSVKPVEMMIGKIVGIGLASLTQVAVWMATAALVSFYGGAMMGGDAPFTIEPSTVAYFAVFFILGYFLYATLYAVVGSVCSSEQDAQQMQILVGVPLVVPVLVTMFVMRHPESSASVALSLIPFFSPVLMFVRINVLMPPAVEILGSILILVATIGAVTWAAARIYRVGILMYGKRATLAEIIHWLRHGG